MRAGQDSGPGPPKEEADGTAASAQQSAQASLAELLEVFKTLKVWKKGPQVAYGRGRVETQQCSCSAVCTC